MWSGAPHWAPWALQPQQYKNMNHEEIDWAELAKQWIQMKENVDAPPPPPPPPPPPDDTNSTIPLSQSSANNSLDGENQIAGEMDMEIEDEKELNSGDHSQPPLMQPQPEIINGEMWHGWWDGVGPQPTNTNWGWGWPMGSQVEAATHPAGAVDLPIEPTVTHNQYSTKPVEEYPWIRESSSHPSLPPRSDSEHRHGRSRSHFSSATPIEEKTSEDFHLDAAQRKKLPLWIREGLEKMEREKQKKLEKERELRNKEELLRKKKEAESQARRILKEDLLSSGKPCLPMKSKFESDSESPDEREADDRGQPESTSASMINSHLVSRGSPPVEQSPSQTALSEEERTAQMMLKLRRWMTEILLDVTSSLMEEVAAEVIQKARRKALIVQVKKPSALSSLSGGLGLSIYSDSEDDEEDGPAARPGGRFEAEEDSDAELRDTIERKQKAFEGIERAILQRLQKQEVAALRRGREGDESPDDEEDETRENEDEALEKGDASLSFSTSPKRQSSSPERASKESTYDGSPEEDAKDETRSKRSSSSSSSPSSSERSLKSDSQEKRARRKRTPSEDKKKKHKKRSKDLDRGRSRSYSYERISKRRRRSRSSDRRSPSRDRRRSKRRSRSRERRRKSKSRDRKSRRRRRGRSKSCERYKAKESAWKRSRSRKRSRRIRERSRSRSYRPPDRHRRHARAMSDESESGGRRGWRRTSSSSCESVKNRRRRKRAKRRETKTSEDSDSSS